MDIFFFFAKTAIIFSARNNSAVTNPIIYAKIRLRNGNLSEELSGFCVGVTEGLSPFIAERDVLHDCNSMQLAFAEIASNLIF